MTIWQRITEFVRLAILPRPTLYENEESTEGGGARAEREDDDSQSEKETPT